MFAGEQIRLHEPMLTIHYGEEITISEHEPGSPEAPTKEEVKDLDSQLERDMKRFEECWRKNGQSDVEMDSDWQ